LFFHISCRSAHVLLLINQNVEKQKLITTSNYQKKKKTGILSLFQWKAYFQQNDFLEKNNFPKNIVRYLTRTKKSSIA